MIIWYHYHWFCVIILWAVFFFPREKIFVTREKNQFSTRENLILPVKKSLKQPVKNNLFPWKISAKSNPWKTKSKAWKKISASIHGKPGPCEKIEKKLVRKSNSAPSQFFHQGQERGFKLSPVQISNWLVRFGGKKLAREKISHTWKSAISYTWKNIQPVNIPQFLPVKNKF